MMDNVAPFFEAHALCLERICRRDPGILRNREVLPLNLGTEGSPLLPITIARFDRCERRKRDLAWSYDFRRNLA